MLPCGSRTELLHRAVINSAGFYMSSKHGWIALSREVTSHWIWSCEPYSKAQAWVDLLLHANHADTKIIIKGTLVHLKRGQQARSQVTLAEQWKWSRDKVKRFLKMLEKDGMIMQQTSQLTSIITVCNYKEFQDIKEKTSQQISHRTSQQADSRQVTVNNDNKENNDNNIYIPFDDFWKIYPRKEGRTQAERKWKSMKVDQELFSKIKQHIALAYTGKEKKFIPHGSTYVNQQRWNDEVVPDKQNDTFSDIDYGEMEGTV